MMRVAGGFSRDLTSVDRAAFQVSAATAGPAQGYSPQQSGGRDFTCGDRMVCPAVSRQKGQGCGASAQAIRPAESMDGLASPAADLKAAWLKRLDERYSPRFVSIIPIGPWMDPSSRIVMTSTPWGDSILTFRPSTV